MFNPDILEFPYNEMLKSLTGVPGYEGFLKFIEDRYKHNDHWKAEIKALFEINKPSHPLIEICSHREGDPEGVFKIGNELGIIEVAFIKYWFDSNDEKKKMINRFINSLDFKKDKNKIFVLPDNETIVKITETAILTRGKNVEIAPKTLRVLKEKRKQHKKKYDGYLKLYYFHIDYFPSELWKIGIEQLNSLVRLLRGGEYLILTATGIVSGNNHGKQTPAKYVHGRIEAQGVFPGRQISDFNFDNIYFKTN